LDFAINAFRDGWLILIKIALNVQIFVFLALWLGNARLVKLIID
jgi:hypothetical protein